MTGPHGLGALYLLGVFATIALFSAGAVLAGRARPPRWYLLMCGLAWLPLLAWRLTELAIDLAAAMGARLGWALIAPARPTPILDKSASGTSPSSPGSVVPLPDAEFRPRGVPTSSTTSASETAPGPLSPDSILAPRCQTQTNESSSAAPSPAT